MKIQMLQSMRGTLDGHTVTDLVEGETYDTVDAPRGVRLAKQFIANGQAIAVEPAAELAVALLAPVRAKPRRKK